MKAFFELCLGRGRGGTNGRSHGCGLYASYIIGSTNIWAKVSEYPYFQTPMLNKNKCSGEMQDLTIDHTRNNIIKNAIRPHTPSDIYDGPSNKLCINLYNLIHLGRRCKFSPQLVSWLLFAAAKNRVGRPPSSTNRFMRLSTGTARPSASPGYLASGTVRQLLPDRFTQPIKHTTFG